MVYASYANKKPTRRERDDVSNTRKCICHISLICLPLFHLYICQSKRVSISARTYKYCISTSKYMKIF